VATFWQIAADLGLQNIAEVRGIGETPLDIIEIATTPRTDPLQPAEEWYESKEAITAASVLGSATGLVIGSGLIGTVAKTVAKEEQLSTLGDFKVIDPSQQQYIDQIKAELSAYYNPQPAQEVPVMDDFFSGIGDLFSGFDVSTFLPSSETFSSFASLAAPIAGAFLTQPTNSAMQLPMLQQPSAVPVSAGSVPLAARAVAAGLPRWSAMFPNLWQAVRTKFPTLSASSAVSGLLSMLKKYGPNALVGMISAAAVQELMTYSITRKRRRMNVANTRALRRSLRRLKGFHRLSSRVSAQLGGSRRRSAKRCGTCRRNPCSC
jgi:hypothetical protein